MSGPHVRTGQNARTGSDDGANQVWGLICTLVAGPAVWGGVGAGVDHLADTAVFLPVGVVVGFVTAFYVVYVKATHQKTHQKTHQTTRATTPRHADAQHEQTPTDSGPGRVQHGRSEVPSRDAARPDPGDVR